MIKMIWCEDINHGIGIDNKLPWSIKDEMNHFRVTTLNHIVVCGEKTFASWGNKPLPHRKNVIVTLDKNFTIPKGVQVFNDFKKVIDYFKNKDIFIIGGKTIYTLFFPYANELIISTLKKSYNCNLFMHFDLSEFEKIKQEEHDEFTVNYYKRVKKMVSNLRLKLKDFEGPLDLLDTLIREKKMDILNLDITALTSQFLNFIKSQINTINIELASEYLEMSAYLISLKSKKIIPNENSLQNDSSFEYERDKFIQRIIQYRKYKEVVNQLQTKHELRNQMFTKQTNDTKEFEPNNLTKEVIPPKISLDKISKAIIDAIGKYKMSTLVQRKILVQELSIQDIEEELWNFLKKYKSKTISFSEYLSKIDPIKITQQFIVTTFLAILDLVRYSKVTISQEKSKNEIYISIIGE